MRILGGGDELELATMAADGGVGAGEFAEAGAVDHVDFAKIQKDAVATFFEQGADCIAKQRSTCTERDFSLKVDGYGAIGRKAINEIERKFSGLWSQCKGFWGKGLRQKSNDCRRRKLGGPNDVP